MTRVQRVLHALTIGLLATTIGRAEITAPDWLLRKVDPTGRSGSALAYDAVRNQVVLFGGVNDDGWSRETWTWDGTAWKEKLPAGVPSYRARHALAYDSARNRIVLFGGIFGNSVYSDTWEWDGSVWLQRTSVTSPSARSRHAMAYDSARGRVVLFGGVNGSSYSSETWEWDGTAWVERTPATAPPARAGHAMAYDGARGRVVLFGGFSGSGYLADTWEWDGIAWVQRTPATSPTARSSPAVAYDGARGRVVLFGGFSGSGYLSDTWEWDGVAWVQRAPATNPSARSSPAMAYDSSRGRVMLFGGYDGEYRSETWEWDGTRWIRWAPAPPRRAHVSMAFDDVRHKGVMFGGYDGIGNRADTWEWDGIGWKELPTATSPTARYDHAMVSDGVSGHVLLFGGNDGFWRDDTWEWDGIAWTHRIPPSSPPERAKHAMAYDRTRGRVVLFGGLNGPFLSDTWEWDGNTWSRKTPPTSPHARSGHAMAYDRARGRVVLFGGYDGSNYVNDTWEWDGTAWVQKAPLTSPPGRTGSVMAYDDARGRVLLFGGYGYGLFDDTWAWDGVTWKQLSSPNAPPSRDYPAMVYDPARDRLVLFGGFIENGYLGDTWEYGPLSGCAHATDVVGFLPGVGTGNASAIESLGPPDGQAVPLGTGGVLVLRFTKPIDNRPGTDLVVYENGVNAGDTNENFRVEASADGLTFTWARDCPGDACQIDLADTGLTQASYVRLTDLAPNESDGPPNRGADIDAVAVMYCDSQPELCNGIDDNGDGVIPPIEIDHDRDGYVACSPWVGDDPSVQGGGDCDDARTSVHPGAQETCNGLDDDCDGLLDEAVVAPSGIVVLTESRTGADAILSWSAIPGAVNYDVVKGDLLALRASGGDFAFSTTACLVNDLGAGSPQDTEALDSGAGRWHLVRATGCGATGSYDEGSASQSAHRDADIQGSGQACP